MTTSTQVTSLPPWPDETSPIQLFFVGIDSDKFKNSIFSRVELQAARAALYEKDHSLIRKFKLISALDVQPWNKITNPDLLDHIINQYYEKLIQLHHVSEQEKLCFLFAAFSTALKTRVIETILKITNDIDLNNLTWTSVKTAILPKFCSEFYSSNLKFKQPKWLPQNGQPLGEYFRHWLENYCVMNHLDEENITRYQWSKIITNFNECLAEQNQTKMVRTLDKSLVVAQIWQCRKNQPAKAVEVKELLVKEFSD